MSKRDNELCARRARLGVEGRQISGVASEGETRSASRGSLRALCKLLGTLAIGLLKRRKALFRQMRLFGDGLCLHKAFAVFLFQSNAFWCNRFLSTHISKPACGALSPRPCSPAKAACVEPLDPTRSMLSPGDTVPSRAPDGWRPTLRPHKCVARPLEWQTSLQ